MEPIPKLVDCMDVPLSRWASDLQSNIMERTSWMGVQTRKNPLDAWICQEIIHEVKPDVIVEIGSWAGGSTLFFAHLLDLLGHGTVVSIDIDRGRYEVEHERIVTITGNSSDPEVIDRAGEVCAGRRVLVSHDGDHRSEQVLRDLGAYSDLVSVGSYFIVEDGIVDLFPAGTDLHPSKIDEGPQHAIREFLARDDRFVVDRSRERFIVTWNPNGFLKRVR